jgi:threonine dehydrogenase-like Zn-dependent dehydrogenase
MKGAVIVKPGTLEVQEIPRPEINEYQVLVEQLACGVCAGTDRKLLEGHFKGFDTYPAVLGHEAVGRVIEKGKKVRNFQIGDLVLRPGLEKIGDGKSLYSGWGAFAQYGIAGDGKAMVEDGKNRSEDGFLDLYYSQQKIPADLDPALGTMVITYKEVLSAVYRFGFRPNTSVMVFGLGPVGLSFVRFCKVLGLSPVIACDIEPSRLKKAEKMGADICLDTGKEDAVSWVKAKMPAGLDFVVDAVGVTRIINLAMNMVKFNGKICVYGISPETAMNLDWSGGPYNWTLQFLQWPTFQEESATHEQIMSWIKMGIIDLREFVSHVLPLSGIKEAFQLLQQRKAFKVVIDLEA